MFARALLGSAVLAAALVASASPARAQVKDRNGEVAPDLGTFQQVNGADRIDTLGALKGKVVLLEFFATW